MTIKLASLKVNTKAEAEGEWIEINEWAGLDPANPWEVTKLPGLKFKVRSVNDGAYKVARQKAFEALEKTKKDYPDEVIPETVADAALGKVIAETLLIGWEGFDEPYSLKYATEILTDPDGRNIRNMVTYCASRVGKREVEFIEEAAKN